MTQSQQPPQMPLPEPLDEQERILARALRNLPVGAPPPELDARILGAARRAVHLAPPRKNNQRRWLVRFGTAASALLAFGVLLKTHGLTQSAIYTPPAETTAADGLPAPINSPSPQDRMQSIPASDKAADQPATTDAAATTTIEPPPHLPLSTMQSPEQLKDTAAQPREETPASHYAEAEKADPQAFPVAPPKSAPRQSSVPPPPPAPPVIINQAAPMSMPPSPAMTVMPSPPAPAQSAIDERAERKTEQKSDEPRRDKEVGAFAASPPAAAGGTSGAIVQDQAAATKPASNAMQSSPMQSGSAQASDAISKQSELDEIVISGSTVRRAYKPLPPSSTDTGLNPAAWIERIRERVGNGDRDGAASSLHAFVRAHPEATIPDDLRPLLH